MKMSPNYIARFLFCFFSATLLFACSGDNNNKAAELPEKKVAMAFFDALYNQKDIKQVIAHSSSKLKKEVQRYKTAKNFARRLLNLQFNSVKMTTAAQKTQIIDEYNTQVTMTVVFTGQRDNGTFKDFKRIRLIKENNAWVVDKILKDT